MPCYHPLSAYQLPTGRVVFKAPASTARAFSLPCGQCHGCRLEHSRQWAIRCLNEARMHKENCFLTLTYDDKHLPKDLSLRHDHFQKFMKRFRFRCGPVRYYMCGEYGELNGRPHFHSCVFGYNFPDRSMFRRLSGGGALYTSVLLSELWPFGFSTIGDVTFESAAYVARYVMKKEIGAGKMRGILDVTTGEIVFRTNEYAKMSLKPGIGSAFVDKFYSDIYPAGELVVRGSKCSPPRYYDNIFKSVNPVGHAIMLLKRRFNADTKFDDNSPKRLRVKEVVSKARISLKRRDTI